MNTQENGRFYRLTCPAEDIALVDHLLEAQGFSARPDPLSVRFRTTLSEPIPLGSSLASYFGYIYIQDRSSMLPPLFLAPKKGETVLDMCASPGGKTGILSQMVGPKGLVVANEPNPGRYDTLRRNLHQTNCLNVVTCRYPGEELPFPEGFFSCILLDAPCSGWGTLDRHPSIKELWTRERAETLVALQRKLLASAARLLGPGGRLVYSTCTTNEEENEHQIRWAMETLGLVPFAPAPPVGMPEYSKIPEGVKIHTQAGAQGFFIAGLTREGGSEAGQGIQPADFPLMDRGRVQASGVDWDRLPPGEMAVFNRRVYFIPRQALERIPGSVTFKGTQSGRLLDRRFGVDPRMRSLLPRPPKTDAVDLVEIHEVQRLLSGQRLRCAVSGHQAGWYWQGLPLGWLKSTGKACLWTGR